MAALNHFVSKATDRCHPFFEAIRKGKNTTWTPKCNEALTKLKEYLGQAPILSKPTTGEALSRYLAVLTKPPARPLSAAMERYKN